MDQGRYLRRAGHALLEPLRTETSEQTIVSRRASRFAVRIKGMPVTLDLSQTRDLESILAGLIATSFFQEHESGCSKAFHKVAASTSEVENQAGVSSPPIPQLGHERPL
jgi:hypothetical protein